MNELLNGIRLLKLFAWERPFADKITETREEELKTLRTYMLLGTITSFFWSSTPLLVSIVSFAIFAWSGHTLTAEIAFTALALFNILRFPMQVLPGITQVSFIFCLVCRGRFAKICAVCLQSFVEALVALKRIETYLLNAELDPAAVSLLRKLPSNNAGI